MDLLTCKRVPNRLRKYRRIRGLKQTEVARETFTRLLDKFQSLCKETNEALGVKLFEYYFPKAKPLWPQPKESNK